MKSPDDRKQRLRFSRRPEEQNRQRKVEDSASEPPLSDWQPEGTVLKVRR